MVKSKDRRSEPGDSELAAFGEMLTWSLYQYAEQNIRPFIGKEGVPETCTKVTKAQHHNSQLDFS